MKKFHVSLAQWSLHRAFQNNVLSHLDFPVFTRKNFDLDGIEYVNCFFKEDSNSYVNELKKRCDDYGIKSLLIMCDDLGRLGDPDKRKRLETVDKHYKWLEIAKTRLSFDSSQC